MIPDVPPELLAMNPCPIPTPARNKGSLICVKRQSIKHKFFFPAPFPSDPSILHATCLGETGPPILITTPHPASSQVLLTRSQGENAELLGERGQGSGI